MSNDWILSLVDRLVELKGALVRAELDAQNTRARIDFERVHRASEEYFDAYETLRSNLERHGKQP